MTIVFPSFDFHHPPFPVAGAFPKARGIVALHPFSSTTYISAFRHRLILGRLAHALVAPRSTHISRRIVLVDRSQIPTHPRFTCRIASPDGHAAPFLVGAFFSASAEAASSHLMKPRSSQRHMVFVTFSGSARHQFTVIAFS